MPLIIRDYGNYGKRFFNGVKESTQPHACGWAFWFSDERFLFHRMKYVRRQREIFAAGIKSRIRDRF